MKVGEIKSSFPRIERELPVVRGQEAPLVKARQVGSTPVPVPDQPVRPATSVPTGTVTPGQGLQDVIAIKTDDPTSLESFRKELGDDLRTLTAAGCTPAAQQAFIRLLDKQASYEDGPARLAEAKYAIRGATLGVNVDLKPLSAYFAAHGLELLPHDRVPARVESLQVDTQGFAEFLTSEAERTDGVIDGKMAAGICDHLHNAVDPRDIDVCKGDLARLVSRGELRFKDSRVKELTEGLFQKLAPGRVGIEEFWVDVRALGSNGFAAEDVQTVRDLIAKCDKNDDALFMAKRVFEHTVRKAHRDPAYASGPDALRLAAAETAIRADLDKKLAGRLDRYQERHELRLAHRDGKLTDVQFMALQGTLVTSHTPNDYAVGVMHAWVALRMGVLGEQLEQAWEDLFKTIAQNLTDDLRDAHGRIIESVGERELKLTLRRREVKRLTATPKQREALRVDAWLHGVQETVLSELFGEPDPNRRASLVSKLAGAESQRGQSLKPGASHV